MPLTEYQKRWALQQEGYDPDEYTLNDDDSITKKIQPSISDNTFQTKVSTKPEFSTGVRKADTFGVKGTFAGTVAHGAPPAIAGGAAFIQAAKLGRYVPGGPVPKAIAGIGLGTLGAMTAGGTTSYLQNLLEQPFIKEAQELGESAGGSLPGLIGKYLLRLKASQQEHPYATTAGEIATIPLSGVVPSPSNVVKAGGALVGKLAGKSIPAEQVPNLINVATGAALQPAIATGKSVFTEGKLPSGGELTKEALLGVLFNKSWALGRMYGMHDTPVKSELPGVNVEESVRTVDEAEINRGLEEQQVRTKPLTPTEQVATGGAPMTKGLVTKPVRLPSGLERKAQVEEGPSWLRKVEEFVSPEELARLEGEGGPQPMSQREREFFLAEQERDLAVKKAEAEFNRRKEAEELAKQQAKSQQQLKMKLGVQATPTKIMERGVSTEDVKPYPGKQEVTLSEVESSARREQARREVEAESPEDLAMRRIEAELAGEERPKYSQEGKFGSEGEASLGEGRKAHTPFEKEMVDLYNRGEKRANTRVWYDMLKNWGAKMRNAKVTLGEVTNKDGSPAAGVSLLGKGLDEVLVKIDPKEGLHSPETVPHELFHVFIDFLSKSVRRGDKPLVDRAYKVVSESPEYQDWVKRRGSKFDTTPNEFFTTEQGAEFIRRQMNLEGETPFKTWLKDFSVHAKNRFNSKNMTLSDYRRLLQYRFQHDPAFNKYFKTGKIHDFSGNVVGVGKMSEEGKFKELPAPIPGQRPIKIRTKSGEIIDAITDDKYWEFGKGKMLNVGRVVEDKWSHGPIRPGEEVIESETTPKLSEQGKFDESRPSGKLMKEWSEGVIEPEELSVIESMKLANLPVDSKVPPGPFKRPFFGSKELDISFRRMQEASGRYDKAVEHWNKLGKSEELPKSFENDLKKAFFKFTSTLQNEVIENPGVRQAYYERYMETAPEVKNLPEGKFGKRKGEIGKITSLEELQKIQQGKPKEEEGSMFSPETQADIDKLSQISQINKDRINRGLPIVQGEREQILAKYQGKHPSDLSVRNRSVFDEAIERINKGATPNNELQRLITKLSATEHPDLVASLKKAKSFNEALDIAGIEKPSDAKFSEKGKFGEEEKPASREDLESLQKTFKEKKRKLDPRNDSVIDLIDKAVAGSFTKTLEYKDLVDIKKTLREQVNWNKSPEIARAINDKTLRPDARFWQDLRNIYNRDFFSEEGGAKVEEPESTPEPEVKETPKAIAQAEKMPLAPIEQRIPVKPTSEEVLTKPKGSKEIEPPKELTAKETASYYHKPVEDFSKFKREKSKSELQKEADRKMLNDITWSTIERLKTKEKADGLLDSLRRSFRQMDAYRNETRDPDVKYDLANQLQNIRMQAHVIHKKFPDATIDPILKFSEKGKFGDEGDFEKEYEQISEDLEKIDKSPGEGKQMEIERLSPKQIDSLNEWNQEARSYVESLQDMGYSLDEAIEYARDRFPKQKALEDISHPDVNEKNLPAAKFNIIRPEIDKIREIEHPDSGKVADAITNFYREQRNYEGKLTNDASLKLLKFIDFKNPKEIALLDNPDMRRVVDYLYDIEDHGTSSINLTPRQKEIRKVIKDNLTLSEAERAKFAGLGTATVKTLPHIPSRSALDTFLNRQGSAKYDQLIRDWYDYHQNVKGLSRPEADQALRLLARQFRGQEKNLAKSFGFADRVAKTGLPRSWRETNLLDIMMRYNNRYARRLAYHKAIELDKDAYDALTDPIHGLERNKHVVNVSEEIGGITEHEEEIRSAIAGLVKAGMLGTLTGSKDFVSNLTLGLQHQDPRQVIPAIEYAWSKMPQHIAESFQKGVNKPNIGSIEFGDGGIKQAAMLARRLRDVGNTATGRNHLERWTRATAFGQGKFLGMDNIWRAHKGNISRQGVKFLDDFAPKNWRNYRTNGVFPQEVLQEIAARYVESVQGTYNYQGLPKLTQRGSLAPVLSLARWNVEKFNNFVKYNVEPASRGNLLPLAMSTLGMILGGTLVKTLVEQITGRKEKTPEIKEITALAEEGQPIAAPIAYKLAALSSLSGYTGVLGDIVNSGMAYSYGKTKPQLYDNPLLIGVNAVWNNTSDALEAWKNGDFSAGADIISQMMEDMLQTYRLALPYISAEKKEDIERANKMRDLKMFKITHGYRVSPASYERPNPFINKDIREFKRTQDIEEAAEMLPDLVEKAIEEADGNLDKLQSRLNLIKQNSYQTMPNPERQIQAFSDYYDFLVKTQGQEEADKRLMDYLEVNVINKAKAKLVPSL